jgi:HEAT repeat protein
MRRYLLGCSAVVILLGALPAASEEPAESDLAILKKQGITADGPSLATFFRQRTVSPTDEAQIKALVRQLGDDEFRVRERASRQLVVLGPRARPFLQAAVKDPDPEIARRATDCLERIAQGTSTETLSAAVRVLARRKPSQAGAVLLNYLPSAEDPRIAETIQQVLPSLALVDGKADPVLLAALTDKSAVKRAASGAALAQAVGPPSRPRLPEAMARVRKLLDDSDAQVRLRVGLVLAAHGDKEAVPVLIRSIDDVPLERNGLVLELLDRLADSKPPPGMPISNQSERRKCRQAWETWWKDHQAKIEPTRLEQAARGLGCTLIVLLDRNTIEYLDPANNVLWKIEGVQKTLDVQLLPDDRGVLVAEHDANRVSQRNRKSEIVWKKSIEGPLAAQRLANGNTFITTTNALVEIDKDGKEVFRYSRPDGSGFMRAVKLPDGDIACIVQLGGALSRYVRLTSSGKDVKEVKSWGVQVRTSGGRIDVLPNGHVLIPEMANNRVVEYDADGGSVWEVAVDQPIAALRLPNGNTLVTLMRENRAVEVDRSGKEVWQFRTDTRVTRALRR